MGISTELQYATLDDLYLDAKNPRLGRHHANGNLSQEEVLEMMREWVLDELAISYLESGFWTHEALLVVEEELDRAMRLVVVEGNRRLAALKYLRAATQGEKVPRKWEVLVRDTQVPDALFNRIPYIRADSRQEIESFFGFRHVTGIKQWNPKEKAQYIARLIDERGMTYQQVMRKIGSKTQTVRENYISYQLLLQMESTVEEFSPEYAEGQFIIMHLTLRKNGVQKYLNIDIMADPETAQKPVPEDHLKNLANFALWLFGSDKQPPLFEDSRQVDNFSTILESPEAVRYLENSKKPNFGYALQLAGGNELETIRLINEAANSIAFSLSHVHHYKDSQKIQDAVKRLSIDFQELLNRFPSLRAEFLKDD
jgi:hypothetical protein